MVVGTFVLAACVMIDLPCFADLDCDHRLEPIIDEIAGVIAEPVCKHLPHPHSIRI